MRILTFNEIKKYKKKFEFLNESISLGLESTEYIYGKSVFLSHSSKDKDDIVPGVIQFLEENFKVKVYIDKEDKSLPIYTNRKTAEILKKRIQEIPTFILIVTKNSFDGKWILWELGLVDGLGKYEDIALLKISEYSTDTEWISQEYLGLYKKII